MSATPNLLLQAPTALMDAFSDVLRVIRLSGGVFLEAHLSAPWCINGQDLAG